MVGIYKTIQFEGREISVGDFIEWNEYEGKSTIGICWRISKTPDKRPWFDCFIIASSHYYPENFSPLSSSYGVAFIRIKNVYKFPSSEIIGEFVGIKYTGNTFRYLCE